MPKKDGLKKSSNNILGKIFFTIFVILFFSILGGGLGVVIGMIATSPDSESLVAAPGQYTTILYEGRNNKELDRLHGSENRIYAELSQIPLYLQKAFIVTEDERFYEHHGIDFRGIARAIVIDIKTMSLSEGASTITQQLIKNTILSQDKNFERKIREQFLAVQLEKKMKKDDILEQYLNTITLGAGINGVQSAANRYFNKDVATLTLSESAVIAGITQNPSKYSPITHPENNKEKQHIILEKLLNKGFISQTQYDEAIDDNVYARIQKVSKKLAEKPTYHSYFVDQVISQVAKDLQEEKGITSTQAYNLIYRGGLGIYTTIDTKIQGVVDKNYKNDKLFPKDSKVKVVYNFAVENTKTKQIKYYQKAEIAKNSKDAQNFINRVRSEFTSDDNKVTNESSYNIPQPQSAMVIIDYQTGYVKALAGGRGEKSVSRNFNRATQAKRQPGSTFKILAAYAPAVDSLGYTPNKVVVDESLTLPAKYGNKTISGNRGAVTIRKAIEDSINVVAVKTLLNVGIEKSFRYLHQFGITTLVDGKKINGGYYSDKTPVVALGGLTDGVTLLELTNAYGAIANKGVYVEPTLYTRVLDRSGNILLEKKSMRHQVIKASTASILTNMMQGVVTNGTGTPARFKNTNMPIAGKTGTTSSNKDLLFVGYTPYYVAGIWSGYDSPEEIRYDRTHHKVLWGKIMEEIHQNLPYKTFDGKVSTKSTTTKTRTNNNTNNTTNDEQNTESTNTKPKSTNNSKPTNTDNDSTNNSVDTTENTTEDTTENATPTTTKSTNQETTTTDTDTTAPVDFVQPQNDSTSNQPATDNQATPTDGNTADVNL